MILGRRQKAAVVEKKWDLLRRILAERVLRTTEVDAIDKKLSWLVASEARNCGSKRRLFRSQEMRLLLQKMKTTLNELSLLERESIRGVEEQMKDVRARLDRIEEGRRGMQGYAPVKSPVSRFVDVRS